MLRQSRFWKSVFLLIIWGVLGLDVQIGETARYKVLTVMTYEEDFFWNRDVKKGIETVLGDVCELKYAYLDVLTNPDGVDEKASDAYALYQEFQPDGVIAADDDVQVKVVIPYLKDKVDTPIIFCGVNEEPEIYGFPTSNVSGILQRPHVLESIIFVQQLVPSVKTIGTLSLDISAGRALAQQVQQEKETYPAHLLDFRFVDTMAEALAAIEELKPRCDALLMGPLGNLLDENGNRRSNIEVYPVLAKAFEKPAFTLWEKVVQYGGILCAITDRGQEQGEVAAEMLLKAMQGTSTSELPITKNKKGKRILNVDVMRELGIKPKPQFLRGVELVNTVE